MVYINTNKNRKRYIDIIKGLSIISIAFIHYEDGIINYNTYVFISLYMVSIFYFCVGWLDGLIEHNITYKELARKRWKQIGKPYIYWTLIILTFDLCLVCFRFYNFSYILQELYKSLTLRGVGTLWFLPALFGGEMIWYYIKKRGWHIKLLVLGLTLLYQFIYNQLFSDLEGQLIKIINAPFRTLYSILNAWIFIAIGYYSYKILKSNRLPQYSLFLISLVIMCTIYIFSIQIKYPFISQFFECIGIMLMFYSCQDLKILNYFEYWGRNSLCLMVTHYSIILVICKIIIQNILGLTFYGWITIFAFCMSMIFQYIINESINKYFPFLLGKNNIRYRK